MLICFLRITAEFRPDEALCQCIESGGTTSDTHTMPDETFCPQQFRSKRSAFRATLDKSSKQTQENKSCALHHTPPFLGRTHALV